MSGYTRQDTSNNIATGNVINATDLDNEFDAVVNAFNATTGHKHDGTSGEGPPITVVGPAQDIVVSSSAVTPKVTSTYDLGSSSSKFKVAYIDTATLGAGTVGGSNITTAANTQTLTNKTLTSPTISGGVITGITDLAVADGGTGASDASGARTNLGLVIGTNVQAYDAGLQSISGLTTLADRMIYTTASDTYAVTTLTSFGRSLVDDADAATARTTLGLGTISTQAASAVAITGGTINGTAIGGSTAAAGAFTGLTSPSLTTAGTLTISATGANVITASTNGSERIRITSDGNVGIGTNAPVSKETIVTSATAGTVIGLNINNPYGYGVGLGLAAAGIRFNRSPNDAGSTGVMADIYAANTAETSSTNGYLVFATRSGASEVTAERMRIFGSGGVSIGNTVDPGATNLSVTGSLTLGTDLSVANGGTGASDAATARTNLGLAIGTNVQAYDAGLQSISGLTTSADKTIYTTGSDTYAVTSLTSFGRSLIDDADAAAARATLGAVIGTDVQAYDADLAALAGISSNGMLARTGAGTAAVRTITAGAGISVTNGDGVSGNPTIAASGITTSELAASTLVTASETIASNDNDTTIPTSAAVKAHVPVAMNASGSAPMFACRAWVYFNGPTAGVSGSGNISSVVRNAAGDYTVSFTTAMPDASYAAVTGGARVDNTTSSEGPRRACLNAAGSIRIITFDYSGGTKADHALVSVAIFK